MKPKMVGGLAVGDVVGVAVVDSLYDLDEYPPGVLLCEVAISFEIVEQLSTLAQTKIRG